MLEAREIPLPYLQNHPSIQDMEVCLWLQRKKLQMFPFVICNLSLSKIWLEFRNGLVAFKLRLLLESVVWLSGLLFFCNQDSTELQRRVTYVSSIWGTS